MRQNETLFINKIKRMVSNYGKDVVVGVGDDAAAVKISGTKVILATCDSQVEGVHFKREGLTAEELGQRAVAAALSDIAAMGGEAKHILVSLVIPKRDVHLGGVYKGFGEACKKYGVDIVGGNISSGKQLVIDIFVLGEIEEKHIVRRSGARVGDAVLVTGTLGCKAVVPEARLKEGQIIAKSGLATSMIDISDGLSTDLLHICDESAVGVRIFEDKLPIAKGVSVDRALNGGEDYELCFTHSTSLRAGAEELIAEIRGKTGTRVTIIGEILDKKEGRWVVDAKGRERRLEAGGWDHLRNF